MEDLSGPAFLNFFELICDGWMCIYHFLPISSLQSLPENSNEIKSCIVSYSELAEKLE